MEYQVPIRDGSPEATYQQNQYPTRQPPQQQQQQYQYPQAQLPPPDAPLPAKPVKKVPGPIVVSSSFSHCSDFWLRSTDEFSLGPG